jgi:purine-binding chemotaxis protein CheW
MKPSMRRRTRASAAPASEGIPHLVFRVAGEDYALRLASVREVVGLASLDVVPGAPTALRGVLDVRGERIAVVDLGAVLGGASGADTDDACALVVEGATAEEEARAGFAVEAVSGVSDVPPEQMAPAPRLAPLIDAGLVASMARVEERLIPILELELLLGLADVRGAIAASADRSSSPGEVR